MTLIKAFILMLLLTVCFAYAQTRLTVAQGGEGMFTTISAALEAAGPGHVIEILDNEVYEEQVTIDSTHHGLTLTSSNPTSSNRPVILWQDTENVHPMNSTEAQDTAMINYDRNGALRVLRARNVTIDGIIVDGGGAMPFAYSDVWESDTPLFHGNAALCLWKSGNTVVRNSEFKNAYFGIYINDGNKYGAFVKYYPRIPPVEPETIIPRQTFGICGNHLIEQNRIHGNSWGIFTESMWDFGSTIRFNLIYNNYHQSIDFATHVVTLPGGENQTGGAIVTRDHNRSPLAVYNNTFHNNYTIFAGLRRSGTQHLIFNNIYSRPKHLWDQGYNGAFRNPQVIMNPLFPSRMKHSIYASQWQEPDRDQRFIDPPSGCVTTGKNVEVYTSVNVLSGMDTPQRGAQFIFQCDDSSKVTVDTDQFISPGALIDAPEGQAFPASANIRWLEIQNYFLNTDDPTHPDFLVPDWEHPVVDSIIKEGGWPEAGIVNDNGSIVDIGAVQSGPLHTVFGKITPLSSVGIDHNSMATLQFDLNIPPEFSNPRIRHLRLLKDVNLDEDSFGSNAPVIETADIIDINPPSTPLESGINSLTFPVLTIPVQSEGAYTFLEMIIEGEGPDGQIVTTDVTTFPYREVYSFDVQILNDFDGDAVDTAFAGERYVLKLAPIGPGGIEFSKTLTDIAVSLNSGHNLYRWPDDGEEPKDMLIISDIEIETQQEVVFTTVPPGGSEYISATAAWMDEYRLIPIFGTNKVVVEPGDPDNVVFENPPSTSVSDDTTLICAVYPYELRLRVFDKFSNPVNVEAPVTIESLNPEIGDISGPANTVTDHTGAAHFTAEVTNGTINEFLTLRATLETTGATDGARLRIARYTSVTRKPGSFPANENFIASTLNPQTPAVTKPEFAVAPNPVNRSESISFYTRRLNYTSAAFSIYDASGNLVKETKARRYNSELPLAEWTSSLTYNLVGRNGKPLAPGSYMVIAVFTTQQGESVRFRERFGVVR
ncbi:right-handed parallel beta-helix repeat-containing protein [Chitinispirillales bacterium ANBcel5]|uniref:hypothetical protein n=1 Tax=Cellulosispirillum alkaliphilum TaxID=3039283 RepID=UPI002A579785|nr:right-handed parallel beta-helix repeat-containing protein [Chitinispirillales bacterium ANBcel5]